MSRFVSAAAPSTASSPRVENAAYCFHPSSPQTTTKCHPSGACNLPRLATNCLHGRAAGCAIRRRKVVKVTADAEAGLGNSRSAKQRGNKSQGKGSE